MSVPVSISSVIVGTGECWLPFVQVLDEIEKVAESPTAESLEDLEQWLSRFQGNFRSLLTTKPKNTKEREYIKLGATEAVALRACEAKQVLPAAWVTETILMSDVLDMNEFQALDLLITGEAEILNYPCWSRGLIAVNMYYEGQHALISALHAMVRLTPGLTWGSRVSHKVIDIVKPFLDTLYGDNLIDKILDLLPRFEVQKQIDILDANLALGDWRHRTEILKHLTGIRVELAQIIFCVAAQERLTWKNTLRILEYLRHLELKRDVKFFKEHILLIACVLYGLDNNLSGDNFDKTFAIEFRKYIVDAESKSTFLCLELLEFLNLAYYTTIYRLLSDVTISSGATPAGRPGFGKGMDISSELLGDEELEFKTDIFTFLRIEIFTNETAELNEEEHVMRRFHAIFTDFINHMPMKLKDMKVRAEDAAKTVQLYIEQGLARPPHLSIEYESFLESMAAFYSLDEDHHLAESFFSTERHSVTLSKFTRSLCHDSPHMFVYNTKLMTGLSRSFPSGVFSLIKQNGHHLSLEHFFESILNYLTSFGKLASTQGPIFQSDAYHRVVLDQLKVALTPHESNGIQAYLQLLQGVCADHTIKMYFADTKRQWIKMCLTSSRIRTLPREVRAEMLRAVAAMIPTEPVSHETVGNLWDIFYSCELLEAGPYAADFREELQEKETRMESYLLCNGFLKLIDNLVKARAASLRDFEFDDSGAGIIHGDSELLDRYVSFVRDEVLLKLAYRSYRSVAERWEMTTLCISILSRLLDEVPVLLVQLLSENPVVKAILCLLVECTKVREMSNGKIPHVDQASWEILNMIYQVVIRQDVFLQRAKKVVRNVVLYGLHDLLLSINLASNRTDYLIALLKFIDKFNPEKHQELSLQILTTILSQHSDMDTHLYAGITSDRRQALILEYTFSQCLSNPTCSVQIKKNILKLLRCSVIHSAPNIGLFLLGADKKIDFQKSGTDKSRPSKTILHYILDNCDELPDVFLTLLVLLRDDRLRESLLKHLRANQFFVKFYIDSFSSKDMEIRDIGYFLKCLSIDLKYSEVVGPLAHVLVSQSNKFLNIIERVELTLEWPMLPRLEFFDQEHLAQAIGGCEYFDRDYKVKVVDLRKLEELFEQEIQKLLRSSRTRMGRSVQFEAKEVLEFARTQNEVRRGEASKLILFECWKQCLEVLLLTPSTLKLAGMDFVTSVLRLVVDKVTNMEGATEAFLRLAAETVLSLCGVLNTFKEDLSESMLNLILTYLCTWASNESTVAVRALLYPSILNIIGIMKEQKKSITSRTNFAVIVDALCKDCLQSVDTGKISSLYLLAEIIHWSMRSGFGGRVPYVDITQPLIFGGPKTVASLTSARSNASTREDSFLGEYEESERSGAEKDGGLRWQDISAISPAGPTQRFLRSPGQTNNTKRAEYSFVEQLNSTTLPMDVRDKQYIAPGEWQASAKDDSFLGFQQKDADAMDTNTGYDIEELEGFKATSNFAAKSTVMNYMQTKGLIRNLIASIGQEDDLGLHALFTATAGSIHLRALLIFNAKMHLFSRFARTGADSALILFEDNLIPRLTDMAAFKMATRLNLWNPIVLEDEEDFPLSLEAKIAQTMIPQRASHVDSLFVAVWSILHSMEGALPNNNNLTAQIWRFVQVNKGSAVSLLARCPTDKETDAELPEALALFASLLAKLGKKIPAKTIRSKDDIYDKVVDTLKKLCRKSALTNAQSFLGKDLLHFLHGYATNPTAFTEVSRSVPCRMVLLSCMSYLELEEEFNGLTVGDILHLVQVAAYRIPNWDGPSEVLSNLRTICELGLTLVYWHLEIFVRTPLPPPPEKDEEKDGKKKKKKDPSETLQLNLSNYMEEVLVKTLTDAFEVHDESTTKNYVQTMLFRIRRLATIKRT